VTNPSRNLSPHHDSWYIFQRVRTVPGKGEQAAVVGTGPGGREYGGKAFVVWRTRDPDGCRAELKG